MGVGRINVWIPDIYKGNCIIDNDHTYVATVQHCNGSVLEWRGGRYQTKDGAWHQILGDPSGLKPGALGFYDGVPGTGDPGHVTFEVPPGCYQVCASWHVWTETQQGQKVLIGNQLTHKAIVKVGCDQDVCVTLYQPTGWHCGIAVLELLIPIMAAKGLIKAEEKANIERGLRQLLEKLAPSEADKMDLEIAKTVVKRLARKKD
jgi:hypothetical protein